MRDRDHLAHAERLIDECIDVRFDPFATDLFALRQTPLRATTGLMRRSKVY
jgi:hypothetical protein